MALTVHKVVASLPGTLVPDAIYAVRAGVGFDLYIADSTGSVAHKVNAAMKITVVNSQAAYDAAKPASDELVVRV